MTRRVFSAHPFLLGFDHLDRWLEGTNKSGAQGYPPFNIEQRAENTYVITIAVAGFSDADLSVRLEDRQLIVAGRQPGDDGGRVYLFKGIAARQFQRSFALAEGMQVQSASLGNGLLSIEVVRELVEPRIRRIEINQL